MTKRGVVLAFVVGFFLPGITFAQDFSTAASLGFEYYNAPSLTRYFAVTTGGVTPGTFMTSVQLAASAEVFVVDDWAVGLEYAYLTSQQTGNSIQIDYSYSLPTLLVHRVVAGENYYLRVGGGIGYHFSSLSQNIMAYGNTTDYSARGIGLKFDAALDTKLGENFYARVSADARAEITGILKTKDGLALTSPTDSREVNSNFSGVGLSFGLVYYF